MRRIFNHIALRTSLIYAFFAGIWIFVSDRLLESHLSPQFASGFQTYKGWTFVSVTAFLLYCALRAQLRNLQEQAQKAAKAEEAALQTATQLRLAVNAANIGFWDRDLRSNKVSFSPEWKRQIGYEEHEIPDQFQEWERRVHPDDLPTVLEKTNRYIADQTTHYQVEFRFRHRNGSYRWILAQASLIYDKSGQPIRMLGSHVDISEIKEWELQLRKSEERLRLAADVAGLASWELDLEAREAIWSEKLFEIIGTTPEQTPPSIESWRRVVHPDDLTRMNQSLALAEKERPATPVFSEYRVIRPVDGEVIWIAQAAQFFFNREEKPTRILGVAYDITERKKREEDLFLRNLALEHSLNGFDIVDENGLFVYANPAYIRMWGYDSLDEIIGTSPVSHCADPSIPGIIIGQLMAKGENTIEFVARRKDNSTFDVLMASRSFRSQSGKQFFISTSLDITNRKHLEKNMSRMNEELEARVARRTAELHERNKDLEAFSYSVSHDLKAPLRGIRAYSHLLLESYLEQLDAKGRRYLQNISQSAAQMQMLIDDLLAYFTLERRTLSITQIDPARLVDAILSERKHDVQNVQLTLDVEPGLIHADAEGLAIALRNLIDNAIKFSADRKPAAITIKSRRTGETYVFSVSDNGTGFDMKYYDRIFQIFQRLHRSEEFAGTGIGLAIVQKAVERMNGRISAESEPDKGAVFHLEIPSQITSEKIHP